MTSRPPDRESVARMAGFDSLPAIVRGAQAGAAFPIPVSTAVRLLRQGISPQEAAARLVALDQRLCRKGEGS